MKLLMMTEPWQELCNFLNLRKSTESKLERSNLLLNIENFNKFLHKNRLTIIKDFAPNGSRLIKAVDAFLLNAQARGLK